MNNLDSEIDELLLKVRTALDMESKEYLVDEAKQAITALIQQRERDMWLYAHDVFRDKSGNTIGIQEAIDAISEAYEHTSGESIEKWLRVPELTQPPIKESL